MKTKTTIITLLLLALIIPLILTGCGNDLPDYKGEVLIADAPSLQFLESNVINEAQWCDCEDWSIELYYSEYYPEDSQYPKAIITYTDCKRRPNYPPDIVWEILPDQPNFGATGAKVYEPSLSAMSDEAIRIKIDELYDGWASMSDYTSNTHILILQNELIIRQLETLR